MATANRALVARWNWSTLTTARTVGKERSPALAPLYGANSARTFGHTLPSAAGSRSLRTECTYRHCPGLAML